MSHALHRHGTAEQLQNDYTFYARASRFVNREGCGPKLRKILSIVLEEKNLVNFGSSHAGKSREAGVAGCFSDREAVKSVLAKLKEADTGISFVISGLIDEVVKIAGEVGLKPHTAFLSLGVHGKRALLPDDATLQVTTMCGHGMVAAKLTKAVMKQVKAGKMTPEAGAHLLAQPCPCGIFNTDRCAAILKELKESAPGSTKR
jgi:hypothetical protein